MIFIQIATGEKRKSTSESFSLEKREGSTKRHSKRFRHQNEASYSTARHPDEAPQFTNGSMSLENCTCSLYAPHSSHKSQDWLAAWTFEWPTKPGLVSLLDEHMSTVHGYEKFTSVTGLKKIDVSVILLLKNNEFYVKKLDELLLIPWVDKKSQILRN